MLFIFLFCLMCGADPLSLWLNLETNIRDGSITRDSAEAAFPVVYSMLQVSANQYSYNSAKPWRIPVENGSLADFGKGGFRPDIRYGGSTICGYNFYDGNRHGGHPAYDIFVPDNDFDCLNDRTKRAIRLLAPVDLFVMSTNEHWQPGSEIRGGNYIWAMLPDSNIILYFAHLNTVCVKPGAFVRQGDEIGAVGRTGKNADNPKSPTHLHMMVLRVSGKRLVPMDFIRKFE
jgi:hypothetical protein